MPWLYFVPVLAPIGLYSWLALRWAIVQFQREEVLFREAERLDLRLWLRQLFRDKEPTPTTGQAFFCFGLILGLRWLSLGLGAAPVADRAHRHQPAGVRGRAAAVHGAAAEHAAAARAWRCAGRAWRELALAAVLAVLLLPPLAGLAADGVRRVPAPARAARRPAAAACRRCGAASTDGLRRAELAAATSSPSRVLPAVCEELAFRGFILTGLQQALPAADGRPARAASCSPCFT